VAVLSLALALGLNTTVYAVLDAFIHPQVPFPNPERLLQFGIFQTRYTGPRPVPGYELKEFMRRRVRFVRDIADRHFARRIVESRNGVDNLLVADVSANFFRVVQVAPAHGRLFATAGERDVAVVSHDTWVRLLNRGPVGATSITVEGRRGRLATASGPS
jgi:hypothetical protein